MSNVRLMTWLVLWLVGLLVALVTGTLSIYAVLTVLYVGSRAYGRLKALRDRVASELGPGDDREE